jgi:hypothetical protein
MKKESWEKRKKSNKIFKMYQEFQDMLKDSNEMSKETLKSTN